MNDVVIIPLTRGQFAIVDADKAHLVTPHKWHAQRGGDRFYARGGVNGKNVQMHRLLMGAEAEGTAVDHRDGQGLNNRTSNLRLATRAQQQHNQRRPQNNTSGYKGVSWEKHARKWKARIAHNTRIRHLGYFGSSEAAYAACCAAALSLFGDFARFE